MKVGDKVLISPDLTLQKEWVSGTIIQVEKTATCSSVVKTCSNRQRRKYVCHKIGLISRRL